MQILPTAMLQLDCQMGRSGARSVAVGFAASCDLYHASFADVLDERTGQGYQRRFNPAHSLDFRRYIQSPMGTSTPLVFNLRPADRKSWTLTDLGEGRAQLDVPRIGQTLAQVDCQHRLGHLSDLSVQLPFMIYIGLEVREELELFSIINAKSKGLSGSLLQLHEASLVEDVANIRPELFIALHLVRDAASPWYQRVDMGGHNTSGLKRQASLATLQKAVKIFLSRSRILKLRGRDDAAAAVLEFWRAVVLVLPAAWSNPRAHVLTKGVGVYALMEIAADIYIEGGRPEQTGQLFREALMDFAPDFDWTNAGPLKGFGGQAGATAAAASIRAVRDRRRLKVVVDG